MKKNSTKNTKNVETGIQAAKQHFGATNALTTIPAVDELRANADADHTFALALVRVSASDPTRMEVVFGTNNISPTDKVLEHAAKKLSAEQKADALAVNQQLIDAASLEIEVTSISAEVAA
ncbi:MAG: hypothetical protein JWP26_878 [Devosia sp.]|uniref:hypothetical protein n=1 Tax=Devosia sp. TaxID=1871048 RepID=UPI002608B5AC|nr:hypothetical protein [Devosia sp.]MDB5585908.1 hypothetical protein [Devosia sp.]